MAVREYCVSAFYHIPLLWFQDAPRTKENGNLDYSSLKDDIAKYTCNNGLQIIVERQGILYFDFSKVTNHISIEDNVDINSTEETKKSQYEEFEKRTKCINLFFSMFTYSFSLF